MKTLNKSNSFLLFAKAIMHKNLSSLNLFTFISHLLSHYFSHNSIQIFFFKSRTFSPFFFQTVFELKYLATPSKITQEFIKLLHKPKHKCTSKVETREDVKIGYNRLKIVAIRIINKKKGIRLNLAY